MVKQQNPVRVLSKPIYGRGIAYYVYEYAYRFTGGANAKLELFHAPRGPEADNTLVTTTEFIREFKVGDRIACSATSNDKHCTIIRITPKTIWTDSMEHDWTGSPLNKLHISEFCEMNLPKKA